MDNLYTLVNSGNTLSKMIHDLSVCSEVGLDTETTGLDPFTCELLLLQVEANNNIYIIDCREQPKIAKYIIQLIKDTNKLCVLTNAKFDVKFIKQHIGEELTNLYDLMIAEVLINQGVGKQFYGLAELVSKYLFIELVKDEQKSFIGHTGSFTEQQLQYSAADVKFLREVKDLQIPKIIESRQERVLELEMRLIPVIAQMELNGVLIDVPYWKNLSREAEEKAKEAEIRLKKYIFTHIDITKYNSILELADALSIPAKTKKLRSMLASISPKDAITWLVENFNPSSPNQMKKAFSLMGVDLPDTNAKTLKTKSHEESVQVLLDYREHIKKVESFGEAYLEKNINILTGRVHTNYNQVGTVTGRMSSNDPNLQQVPKEKEYRRAFIARKGRKIIAADYSQQEYRLTGAISGEPAIIKAYQDGLDMHTATACILYPVTPDQVEKYMRNRAKGVNFATLYGSSEYGLSYNLQMSVDEAREVLNTFYAGYPVLTAFKKVVDDLVVHNYYSTTMLGRRRYWRREKMFPSLNAQERYENSMRREGFNLIVQGTGADVTKIALCNLYFNNPFGDKFHLLLQVHDEIVCEVDEDIVEEGMAYIKDMMIAAFQPFLGDIPAEVEADVANYWVH